MEASRNVIQQLQLFQLAVRARIRKIFYIKYGDDNKNEGILPSSSQRPHRMTQWTFSACVAFFVCLACAAALHQGLPKRLFTTLYTMRTLTAPSWTAGQQLQPERTSLTLALPPSISLPTAAELFANQLIVRPWTSRADASQNMFLVWTSHRDSWTLLQDRVVASILANIPNVRLRLLSNTLPRNMFTSLGSYDVAVMPYDIEKMLLNKPGSKWFQQARQRQGPHFATHMADLIRVLALVEYGGVYSDCDHIWLQGVKDLPDNFIGKLDYLRLEPKCDFCIDGRWYLGNGVLSFSANHPFLYEYLHHLDSVEYDPSSRTHIGPRMLTELYLRAEEGIRKTIILIDEDVIYPIPGPDVPLHLVQAPDAAEFAQHLLDTAIGLHTFAYTYQRLLIHPESTYGLILGMFGSTLSEPLCECVTVQPHGWFCFPRSVVIPFQELPHGWYWPFARICMAVLSQASPPQELDITVTAQNGLIRTWQHAPAKTLYFTLAAPHQRNDNFASLEYRHTGGYCNDHISVTFKWEDHSFSHSILVSAPCLDADKLLSVPPESRMGNPASWKSLLGPVVPSITALDLQADAGMRQSFETCLRLSPVPPKRNDNVSRPTKIGLLVSATGKYVDWLHELISSAEIYFALGSEVHYFVLTDVVELQLEPRDRIHTLPQPKLGWPYDSMFRHQLYLKHRQSFNHMDYLFVLDADAVFLAPVSTEILGETVGCLQSFFWGQDPQKAPFERNKVSSSYIPHGTGDCYYAGGLFGGTYDGIVQLLKETTWLMEWDIVTLGKTAPHDDESYLNKAFHTHPPAVSLGGNYIFPEPPADRAWGLSGVNWQEAYPPVIYNLGARKWLDTTATQERDYTQHANPVEMLTAMPEEVSSPAGAPTATLAVCVDVKRRPTKALDWMNALAQSVRRWYHQDAKIIILDITVNTDNVGAKVPTGVQYFSLQSFPKRDSEKVPTKCTSSAFRLILDEISTKFVVFLPQFSVLTWQSSISLLAYTHDQQTTAGYEGVVVSTCATQNTADAGRCDVPTSSESSAKAANYECKPCNTTRPTDKLREVLRMSTPLRTVSCHGIASIAHYGTLLTTTTFAREAVASLDTSPAGKSVSSCDIACLLDTSLHSRGRSSRSLVECLPDFQTLQLFN